MLDFVKYIRYFVTGPINKVSSRYTEGLGLRGHWSEKDCGRDNLRDIVNDDGTISLYMNLQPNCGNRQVPYVARYLEKDRSRYCQGEIPSCQKKDCMDILNRPARPPIWWFQQD